MTRHMLDLVAVASLTIAAACASRGEATPAADSVVSTEAATDTALLSAAAVKLAGFSTAAVAAAAWRETWSAPARVTLDPSATEPIGAIAEGRVMKVYAMPGDRVRRGNALVAIHSHELMDARAALVRARADLAKAEAGLRLASSGSDRAERLHTLKALSLADLERARAAKIDAETMREAAQAELERAVAMVEHLVGAGALPAGYDEHWVLIRSPIDGVVVSRDAQPGSVVLVGAPLLTVSRTSALTLVVALSDASIAAARVGSPIRFTVPAHPGRTFEAKVVRIFPAIDTITRTVEVQASIVAPHGELRAEMYATAELLGPGSAPVLSVPAGAIQAFEGDTVVIEAQQRGEGMRLEALRVRTGRRTRERVEIVAGIDSGRLVVVGGASIAKAEILKRRGGE